MGGIVSSSGEEKRSSSFGMLPTTSIFSASAIHMQHKLSQSEWRRIGKETGWLKEAGNRLGDLIEAKIGLEDADFYIVRRGTPDAVGRPTKDYNPEHIGIRVTRTDVLLPQYLFYLMQHLHGQGHFRRVAKGTTALVGIRVGDITHIQLGGGDR